MKKDKLGDCPLCNSNKTDNMLNLNCGNLDGSVLYQYAKINACEKCGHIYNDLSLDEINSLMNYYNSEYALSNIGSTDKIGDRPGNNNQNTARRYDQQYKFIADYIKEDCRILDVGCAMGGFLNYLSTKGVKNLAGIDPIEKYIDYAKKNSNHNIKNGSVESIPFSDKVFDILVMDQVMEHVTSPVQAFREAKRVLVDGGLLSISVPDASRYYENYFFDFFWFLIREHIQHYDLGHLKLLAAREGFELVAFNRSDNPIVNEKMVLPNLSILFSLAGNTANSNINDDYFALKKEIKGYIDDEFKKLDKKKVIIKSLIDSQRAVYVWGIGREFLYLFESASLKKCNLSGLIDINEYKQKNFSVNSHKINDKSILKKAIADSALIISAVAYTEQIKNTLSEIGYTGQIIEF